MKKYIEFHKNDVEEVLKKLAEKKYTNILSRTIDGVDYCSFTHSLIYGKSNLKYFEPFMKNRPNKCFICGVRARYNYKFSEKTAYCGAHKLEGMCFIGKHTCAEGNCIIRGSYGIKGSNKLYCLKHKKEETINIIKKPCLFENCSIRPNYNYDGEKKKLYCVKHKLEGMIVTDAQKCAFINCKITPSYNFEEMSPKFCSSHKEKGMVNVKHKKCIVDECNKRSIYNFIGQKPLYCSLHKEEVMINVKIKKCKFMNCNITPFFGFKGQKPIFCSKHKELGMLDIKTKKCAFINCEIVPNYNFDGLKKKFCKLHKELGMIDVTHKRCLTPLCGMRAKGKYGNYCLRCFIYLFPEKPNAKNYRTKEFSTKEFLEKKFLNFNWINNKQIGQSKKRPDLLLKLKHQAIIVEIDENAHNNEKYCVCENKRMMEISQDLNHKPIIFIRFNPDKYYNNENEKIMGCWKINGNGICVIVDEYKWRTRLNVLSETIGYWIENTTEKTIEQIFLYYNGFN